MILAIILVVLVVASVLFHILSPWHATPIASNWGNIDDTITITVVITGVFFIAITLFMAYAIYRFRHKDNSKEKQRADYEPENKKLEWILIAVTTVGICGLLAPGLFVYGDFVRVPDNAIELEAVGQQWRWTFRQPGEDGQLGTTAISHVSAENPFGIDPNDPNGQDDVLINSNQVHVLLDQPIKLLLRSKDVLHDFYVPQFRVKMDLIPGLVTYMWFTPTRTGQFEVLCSELCGVGHYNMRGKVIVDTPEDYQAWLQQQPTFASSLRDSASGGLVEQGRKLAEGQGCLACHSVDGSKSIGPGWKNLFGTTEILADGSTVTVDAAYLRESIVDPNIKMVKDYPPVMVAVPLSDEQLDALLAYIQSLTTEQPIEPQDEEPQADQANELQPVVELAEAEPIAEIVADTNVDTTADAAERGRQLSLSNGCVACHSTDGSKSLGPSWKGLWGKTETLSDGSTVVVDEDYFKESIIAPKAKNVKGYPQIMVPYTFSEDELQALIAFAQSMADADNKSQGDK